MKILCVARNYAPHAAEMQSPVPAEPAFFMKPQTALQPAEGSFRHPEFSSSVHHEVEVVVRIEKFGSRILESEANQYYNSVALGIDFTARDLQAKAKAASLPWLVSKGFDGSAPVSRFVSLSELGKPVTALNFSLCNNGVEVQKGNTEDWIFPIDRLIAHISRYIALEPGDLIYTGTPAGVAAVNPGDHLDAYLEGLHLINLDVQ